MNLHYPHLNTKQILALPHLLKILKPEGLTGVSPMTHLMNNDATLQTRKTDHYIMNWGKYSSGKEKAAQTALTWSTLDIFLF